LGDAPRTGTMGASWLLAVAAAACARGAAAARLPAMERVPGEVPWQERDSDQLVLELPVWREARSWFKRAGFSPQGTTDGELGRGTYGTVIAADAGRAVKILHRKLARTRSSAYYGGMSSFQREAVLLNNLRSEHVLRLLGTGVVLETRNAAPQPVLLLERAEGPLSRHLDASPIHDLVSVLELLRQAVEGLAHIAEQGVIHGDVSLDNIFVFELASRVKLADFGIGCVAREHATWSLGCQRILYKAMSELEVPKTDVWAMGLVIYQAVFRRYPYTRPPKQDEDTTRSLCIKKYCPPYLPWGANYTCTDMCATLTAEKHRFLQLDLYWGERAEYFNVADALPEAGPTALQTLFLREYPQAYQPLRGLLRCMLQRSPLLRCSARAAADRLRRIIEGLRPERPRKRARRGEPPA